MVVQARHPRYRSLQVGIFTLNSSYETWEPAQFACLRAWDDAPGRFKRTRGCLFLQLEVGRYILGLLHEYGGTGSHF